MRNNSGVFSCCIICKREIIVDERTMLSPNEVANLLRFRLDATFLAYKNGFYKLTFGTAMGPPVSVTVAIFVMGDVKERAISS